MIYLDTETCGLHGVVVLIQWAEDNGPINLFSPWTRPIKETLALIEYFCEHKGGICAFNMAFDWFHLQKIYCMFRLHDPEWYPDLHIQEIASREREAIWGPCIKPQTALDLMLHAVRGPYQSVMERKDIAVRRVPTVLAESLARELSVRIPLKDIYFARKAKSPTIPGSKIPLRWTIRKSKRGGEYQVGFSDVVLSFAASRALKNICRDALTDEQIKTALLSVGITDATMLSFKDVEVPKQYRPSEVGWAPFADAAPRGKKSKVKGLTGKGGKGKFQLPWPEVVEKHINHWGVSVKGRQYAALDVVYLRLLRAHFSQLIIAQRAKGSSDSNEIVTSKVTDQFELDDNNLLAPGDDDSILACSVASVRWRGYSISKPKIEAMIASLEASIAKAPRDANAVRRVMQGVMTPMEFLGFKETNKKVLAEIEKWVDEDDQGNTIIHPAAMVAKDILKARTSEKLLNMFRKILKAGRLHASFKVIGTLSGRMSGTDGFNPHAVNRANSIRECFTFSDNSCDLFVRSVPLDSDKPDSLKVIEFYHSENFPDGTRDPSISPLDEPFEELSGGDYASFEVSIAEAEYKDPLLREELMSGKKIHALFGCSVRKELSYDEIVATDGTEDDVYSKSKTCVFAIFYGAMAKKISEILDIPEDQAEIILNDFFNKYQQVGVSRAIIFKQFCSMVQKEQHGQVYWKDPADYIESALGFRRYFSLENLITKALFDLANSPPKEWSNIRLKITRRRNKDGTAGKEQTVAGATCSALYGSAFGLQALNMRAACNHVIQAFGASITKRTQRKIWDMQPSGIRPWRVRPANFHDEINAAHSRGLGDEMQDVAEKTTASFKPVVPLIRIDWKQRMADWSGKHG